MQNAKHLSKVSLSSTVCDLEVGKSVGGNYVFSPDLNTKL